MFQTVFYITAKGHPLDIIIYIYSIWQGGVRMDQINDIELIQKNVEEFSRLQTYMLLVDKASEAYKTMKIRYIELKVILAISGINLTNLDVIKD